MSATKDSLLALHEEVNGAGAGVGAGVVPRVGFGVGVVPGVGAGVVLSYYRSNQWRKLQIKELFLFLFLQNLKNEIPVILIAFACKICRS